MAHKSQKSKGDLAKSKKQKIVRKKAKSTSQRKKKKVHKKPMGPTGTKKWPKKKRKKWPPKRKKKKPKKTSTDSSLLQAADFSPHIGTTFNITDFDPVMPLTLIDVTSFGTQSVPSNADTEIRTEPFSLQFYGPVNVSIDQDVYTLQHAQMGELVMLLVPIGTTDTARTILEAIYN